MDKTRTGYVNFSKLATYIVLLQSPLPLRKELAEYDLKLSVVAQGEYISKENFVNVEAWFDLSEDCEQRIKAQRFDRVTMIKEILFEVNKNIEKVS